MELSIASGRDDWDPVEAEATLEAVNGRGKAVRLCVAACYVELKTTFRTWIRIISCKNSRSSISPRVISAWRWLRVDRLPRPRPSPLMRRERLLFCKHAYLGRPTKPLWIPRCPNRSEEVSRSSDMMVFHELKNVFKSLDKALARSLQLSRLTIRSNWTSSSVSTPGTLR